MKDIKKQDIVDLRNKYIEKAQQSLKTAQECIDSFDKLSFLNKGTIYMDISDDLKNILNSYSE